MNADASLFSGDLFNPDTEVATPREAALVFLHWANKMHMVDNTLELGIIGQAEAAKYKFQILDPLSESSELLRAKQIIGIAYDDSSKKINVLLKRKIGPRQIAKLPAYVLGCNIEYTYVGNVQAGAMESSSTGQGYSIHCGKYTCGSSVHPARYPGAGTMGAILKDEKGNLYGLSNNHVTGMCNYSDEGEKILAPGHIDISSISIDPFTIGTHVRSLNMVAGSPSNVDICRNMDAAVFTLKNHEKVTSHQGLAYDTPSKVVDPVGGMIVEKIGRTTNHTHGLIKGINPTPMQVRYEIPAVGGNASVYFENTLIVNGLNNSIFSASGDSGSLVTTVLPDGERAAVGLVFAGNGSTISVILPLRPILEALQMSLVSGHNV